MSDDSSPYEDEDDPLFRHERDSGSHDGEARRPAGSKDERLDSVIAKYGNDAGVSACEEMLWRLSVLRIGQGIVLGGVGSETIARDNFCCREVAMGPRIQLKCCCP